MREGGRGEVGVEGGGKRERRGGSREVGEGRCERETECVLGCAKGCVSEECMIGCVGA